MRRSLAVLMAACLLSGAAVGTADAAKKKKKKGKKKPPVTFEAEGTLAVGNPLDFMAGVGLTRAEFEGTCSIPASQGVDGFVVELPEAFEKLSATAMLRGSDAVGLYDMDMFFFSADCQPMGQQATEEYDELGYITPGTRFVLVSSWMGADISFTLEVKESRDEVVAVVGR